MRNCLEILFKQCWQLLLWPLKGTRGRVFLITRFSIPGQYNTKVHCTEIILIWPNEIFLSVLPFKNEHLLGQKFKYASLTRLVPSIYYFFPVYLLYFIYLIDLFCGQRQSQFLAILIKKAWSLKKPPNMLLRKKAVKPERARYIGTSL